MGDVFGLVVAILAVIAVRSLRGRDRPAPAGRQVAPIDMVEDADLPTFNVIALGGQETGKTVLLASMFHRLATEIRCSGFHLDTSLDQAVHLTNLYAKLRDPASAPPAATSFPFSSSTTSTTPVNSSGADCSESSTGNAYWRT